MANTVRINAAALNRPGVFVSQSSTGGLPQPIATHAVAYVFGTTQGDEYYEDRASSLTYSPLLPYEPTQIASAEDFVLKTGGSIPSTTSGALVTYDSVKAFFDNVGVNGIMYFTRVSPTPETVVDLSASSAGSGYNAFAVKINGRYFGTPTGIYDGDGSEIRIITTTGLDKTDNARDLYQFMADSSAESDNFSDFYRVEQTATEALAGKFRIFSRDVTNLPEIEVFKAYAFNTEDYAGSGINLLGEAGVVRFYTSVKELNFRCISRDVATGEGILFLSGAAISQYIKAANDDNAGTYDPSLDQSLILENFLVNQGIYESLSDIPDGKYIAVSKDLTNGFSSANTWRNQDAAYWIYESTGNPGTHFSLIKTGSNNRVPSGTVTLNGGVYSRSGYLPDTVQAFYLSIAGENRVVIINGSTPDELTESLRDEIQSVLVEKELDRFYQVESVSYDAGDVLANNLYVSNNGYKLATLVADAGSPYLRPDAENLALTGTVAISGANLAGTGTQFSEEIAPGATIVVNGTRFSIVTVTDNDTATVSPTTETISAGATARLDKSFPNGFYSHDYVLKIKITSKNGVSSPILPGRNRFGTIDANVVRLVSQAQDVTYESYKLTQQAKAQDFVFAIEEGMGSKDYLAPGFVLAPEAYAVLVSGGANNDISSKGEARLERIKVTQALTALAEGRIGQTEGLTGTQHIALIDVGGDEINLTEAQDELNLIKSLVGVPFGHASYYAPYIKNLNDRYVPPSGFIAGIACSRYVNEGFQQPPAGSRYPLRSATGLKFEISAQQQEVTYALGLNPIRSLPNRGIVAWGARTLSPNPLFKFVNTRAILNVLVDVLNRSFDDALFEQIDSAGTLYARIKSIASQVLSQFYRQGALFGARPEQAYSISCSSANNNENLLEQGTVRADIYVATSPTLERLAITVVRTPAGQVSLISDSFSRNEERYTNLLNTTSTFL
jgi:hypothetical protein